MKNLQDWQLDKKDSNILIVCKLVLQNTKKNLSFFIRYKELLQDYS